MLIKELLPVNQVVPLPCTGGTYQKGCTSHMSILCSLNELYPKRTLILHLPLVDIRKNQTMYTSNAQRSNALTGQHMSDLVRKAKTAQRYNAFTGQHMSDLVSKAKTNQQSPIQI